MKGTSTRVLVMGHGRQVLEEVVGVWKYVVEENQVGEENQEGEAGGVNQVGERNQVGEKNQVGEWN